MVTRELTGFSVAFFPFHAHTSLFFSLFHLHDLLAKMLHETDPRRVDMSFPLYWVIPYLKSYCKSLSPNMMVT